MRIKRERKISQLLYWISLATIIPYRSQTDAKGTGSRPGCTVIDCPQLPQHRSNALLTENGWAIGTSNVIHPHLMR